MPSPITSIESSTPSGIKTTASTNSVHSFFTPRRAFNSAGSRAGPSRVRLLAAEESPSQRSAKRPRVNSFAPVPSSGLATIQKLDNRDSEQKLEPEPQWTYPKPRQRRSGTTQYGLLMRSLNGSNAFSAPGRTSVRGFHFVGWSSRVLKFYSRPDDLQAITTTDERADPVLPFCTAACNRNSLVAVGDESGVVRLIESAKDEKLGFSTPYLTLQCHDNAIFDLSWSTDDRQLATASGDQTCRIFDITRQQKLYTLQHHQHSVKQVTFNPQNPYILASSSRDGVLNIWDLRISGKRVSDGRDVVTVFQPIQSVRGGHQPGHKPHSITAAVWIEEHKLVTACENDSVIKAWDLRSSYIRRKKSLPVEISPLPPIHALPSHRNFGINCLTLSPDRQRLYALCKDSRVYAYSTNHLSNGPIHAYGHPSLHADSFYVKSDISRDGQFISTGSSAGVAVVFPTEERYFDPMVSSDFTYPVSSTENSFLKVGRGVALVNGHDKEVTDVTWTIGGDLVSVSDNYSARCWRMGDTGEEAESLRNVGEGGGQRWGWGLAEMGVKTSMKSPKFR